MFGVKIFKIEINEDSEEMEDEEEYEEIYKTLSDLY